MAAEDSMQNSDAHSENILDALAPSFGRSAALRQDRADEEYERLLDAPRATTEAEAERQELLRLEARAVEFGVPGAVQLVRYIEGLEIQIQYMKDKLGW